MFFNKVDLLEEKLRKGADVLKYLPELDQPKNASAKFREPLPSDDSAELEQIIAARYTISILLLCKNVQSSSRLVLSASEKQGQN